MKPNQKYTIIVLATILIITCVFYFFNKYFTQTDGVAKPFEYSDEDNYQNITPMKHDIFKQLVLDFTVIFFIFFFVEVIGGFESFFDWKDFLTFENFREFRLSVVGQSMISVLGYAVYYQIIQPYFVNTLPKF